MIHAFWLDGYPTLTLVTEAAPEPRAWNGFTIPNPTPRELVTYLDGVRAVVGVDEYWDAIHAFTQYYGERLADSDTPFKNVDGFTWMKRRVFDPMLTQMTMGMARGHHMRMGHELEGYYVPAEGLPEEWDAERLIRTCCPQEIPS